MQDYREERMDRSTLSLVHHRGPHSAHLVCHGQDKLAKSKMNKKYRKSDYKLINLISYRKCIYLFSIHDQNKYF